MERLPYIDEHAITIPADRAETWQAVLEVICRDPHDPGTVPVGFVLDDATPFTRLALKGRHWFSAYKLVFELDDARDSDGSGAPGTTVRAQTWAAFPGVKGRIYRALVIGSGAHRIAVGRMLKHIAITTRTGSSQRP